MQRLQNMWVCMCTRAWKGVREGSVSVCVCVCVWMCGRWYSCMNAHACAWDHKNLVVNWSNTLSCFNNKLIAPKVVCLRAGWGKNPWNLHLSEISMIHIWYIYTMAYGLPDSNDWCRTSIRRFNTLSDYCDFFFFKAIRSRDHNLQHERSSFKSKRCHKSWNVVIHVHACHFLQSSCMNLACLIVVIIRF